MKLMPLSRASCTICVVSFWPRLPMFILPPNCIVPRATSLTMSPVFPSFLYFIAHTPSSANENCDSDCQFDPLSSDLVETSACRLGAAADSEHVNSAVQFDRRYPLAVGRDFNYARRAAGFYARPMADSVVTTPFTSDSPVPPNVSIPRRTAKRPTGLLVWTPTAPSAWVVIRSNIAWSSVPRPTWQYPHCGTLICIQAF